jgi:uncharacterized protein
MEYFSLLIKPASADCNLRCSYCFYLEKSLLYPETDLHRMDTDTLEKIISSYLATDQSFYSFGWQGGEPTLMGQLFFEKVVELQKKYAKARSLVSNGLQTNGTLIDNDFAKFLSRYNFLIGISLDGPKYIHDKYRKTIKGEGSYNNIMDTIGILKKNNIEFNVLVLINNHNVNKVKEIYEFLIYNDIFYHQYVPCVEFDNNSNLKPYSINGEQWGNFLIELFNLWYPRYIYKISIRLFDSIINRLLGLNSGTCSMEDRCNQYLLVEYNGDIYPCDFFVREDLILGNIKENSFEKIISSPIYSDFGKKKSSYSFLCSSCQYLDFCYGDCLKFRNYNPDKKMQLSRLCAGWKMFYDHTLDIFRKIANNISL